MDLIGDRKIALQNLKQKTPYLAIGWGKNLLFGSG